MTKQPTIRAFFDEPTNTVSYLVADPVAKTAAIIDPVLDFDQNDGTVDTAIRSGDAESSRRGRDVIEWVLETHAHADHLSGAPYIKAKTGAKIGIGEHTQGRSADFPAGLQCSRSGDRRKRLRSFVQGWRTLPDRRTGGRSPVHAGSRPRTFPTRLGMRCLSVTHCSCRITGRHAQIFPAGDARQLYQSIKRLRGIAARNPTFHVPRLQGAWPRSICVGDDRQRTVREERSCEEGGVTEDEFAADAFETRCDTCRPRSAPLHSGQHPGGKVPTQAGQRRVLSSDSRENKRWCGGLPAICPE